MTNQAHRILRNYRTVGPTRFHTLNQRVRIFLADKTRIPESFWAAHPALLQAYLEASEKYDAVYHESMLGSKLVIAEREVLQAQLVNYLDEIASLLEMTAVRTPEILVASGFDVTKERRGHSRAKAAAATHAEQEEGKNSIPV